MEVKKKKKKNPHGVRVRPSLTEIHPAVTVVAGHRGGSVAGAVASREEGSVLDRWLLCEVVEDRNSEIGNEDAVWECF